MSNGTKTYKTLATAQTAAAKANAKGVNVAPLFIGTNEAAEEYGFGKGTIGQFVLVDATELESGKSSHHHSDAEDDDFIPEPAPGSISDTISKEELTDDKRAELERRANELREELGEVEQKLASPKTHTLVTSAVTKPVRLCREVFVTRYNAAKEAGTEFRRKDIISALTGMGVAPNTAKTQYGLLKMKLDAGTLDLTEFDDEGEDETGE